MGKITAERSKVEGMMIVLVTLVLDVTTLMTSVNVVIKAMPGSISALLATMMSPNVFVPVTTNVRLPL